MTRGRRETRRTPSYSGVPSASGHIRDGRRRHPAVDGRAEQAAHRGDFAAAEEALRLAVELQERTLGASSPEVASTLNNLGIVYERLNRPAEAESCYRKSFAIAKAAFASDHPLVETSATNLREFCDARGIPFEPPEPAPVSARVETPAPAPPSRASSRGVTRARRRDVIGIVSSPDRDSARSSSWQ